MPKLNALLLFLLMSFLLCCAGKSTTQDQDPLRGFVSWYGPGFHGKTTASGEVYDMHGITAAHKSLPFGTLLEVVRVDTGKKVVVRVNDRGPFVQGRVLDVSHAAAKTLGLIEDGTAPVELKVLTQVSQHRNTVKTHKPSAKKYLQVGAFKAKTNAASYLQQMLRQHPGTQGKISSNNAVHRVWLGPMDENQAKTLAETLKSQGIASVLLQNP